MDGEQGGGGDPSEIPGLTGKTIARAGYTEWQAAMDKPPGEPSAKRVRGVRLDLQGGDIVHMISKESIVVGVEPIARYPWLANVPGAFPDPPIDYRSLMVRYMRLVGVAGSWTGFPRLVLGRELAQWVDDLPELMADLAFTDSEWAELQRLQRLAAEAPR